MGIYRPDELWECLSTRVNLHCTLAAGRASTVSQGRYCAIYRLVAGQTCVAAGRASAETAQRDGESGPKLRCTGPGRYCARGYGHVGRNCASRR
jgi:hypothetical protein